MNLQFWYHIILFWTTVFLIISVLMSYNKNTTGDNKQSLKVEREWKETGHFNYVKGILNIRSFKMYKALKVPYHPIILSEVLVSQMSTINPLHSFSNSHCKNGLKDT